MLHQTPLDEPSRTCSQGQNCCGSLGVQTAASWYYNVAVQQLYKAGPMLENYVDVIEASKILDVHPETVKRLIREGKLTATKFGNKWIMDYEQLQVFANTYDGRRGRARRLL